MTGPERWLLVDCVARSLRVDQLVLSTPSGSRAPVVYRVELVEYTGDTDRVALWYSGGAGWSLVDGGRVFQTLEREIR